MTNLERFECVCGSIEFIWILYLVVKTGLREVIVTRNVEEGMLYISLCVRRNRRPIELTALTKHCMVRTDNFVAVLCVD